MKERGLRRIDYSHGEVAQRPMRRIEVSPRHEGKEGKGKKGESERMGKTKPRRRQEVRRIAKDKKPRVPKNKPGTGGVYVPNIKPSLREKLKALAKGEGVGVMDLYLKAFEDYADGHKVKAPDGGKAKKARKPKAKKAAVPKGDGGEAPKTAEAATEEPSKEATGT